MNTAILPDTLAQLSEDEKRSLLARLLQAAATSQPPILSVTQERLWQLDQLRPGLAVYNFQSAIELSGPVDAQALERAIQAVVARHDVLRTAYGSNKGQPGLRIIPALTVPLAREDWRDLTPEDQRANLQQRARDEAQQSFTLAEPPLLRLRLITLAVDRHVLILTMHHIVSDLLSLDIFLSELGALYSAGRGVPGTDLPPLTASYQDFARFQRNRNDEIMSSPAAAYWRQALANPPALEWMGDYPRPEQPSGKAGTLVFTLSADDVARTEAAARTLQVTPFMLLLTVFFLLTHAVSGEDDIVVGAPTAGRIREEYESLIGMFSYPMALRLRLDGNPSFRDLLRRVRQTVLGAAEHGDMPFARVVELAQRPGGSQAPLMRAMFSYVSRLKVIDFAGTSVRRLPLDRGMNDFDLFLTVYQDQGQWCGVFEYNTDLFLPPTAEAWAAAYAGMLRTAVSDTSLTVAQARRMVPVQRPLHLAIAATFTADALQDVCGYWSRELRLPIRTSLAPYNQVFQMLLNPDSVLNQPDVSVSVVLVRPEDWCRYATDAADRDTQLADFTAQFIGAVESRATKSGAPLHIYLCPPSPDAENKAAILASEQAILHDLAALPGVTVRNAADCLVRYPIATVHDAQADKIGHIPFTEDWFVAFGTTLVRQLTAATRRPYKVVVLDCDNTLWKGIRGEDGLAGITVPEPFQRLQTVMRELSEAGMLLCLVSKNDEADVLQVLGSHPGMVLRPGDIVAHRINWDAKSANIRSLAAELGLGLDSIIFIDDNPVECAEVQAACPQVLTLCLPTEPDQIVPFIEHVWAFDRAAVSDEDRNRSESYKTNRQRRQLQSQAISFRDFIRDLGLTVDIAPSTEANLPRIAQLSQRTNQFNASGLRFDEAALRQAVADGLQCLSVRVRDRFGDYGLVGVLAYRLSDQACRVDSLLLSCRVLGRGVEHQMIRFLGEQAHAAGLRELIIIYRELPRNQPVLRFLRTLAATCVPGENGSLHFVLDVDAALATRFEPNEAPAEPSDAEDQATASAATPDVPAARHTALGHIAHELRDVAAIRARMKKRLFRRHVVTADSAPRSNLEQTIAEIWQQVLHVDQIGRSDNFFEVGGNSLMMVQVNSLLIAKLGRDIMITELFQYPTITLLAGHLDAGPAEQKDLGASQERGQRARRMMQQRMQRQGATRHG